MEEPMVRKFYGENFSLTEGRSYRLGKLVVFILPYLFSTYKYSVELTKTRTDQLFVDKVVSSKHYG